MKEKKVNKALKKEVFRKEASRKTLLMERLYASPSSLTLQELAEIQKHPALKAELAFSEKIESEIQNLPRQSHTAPPRLRDIVLERILVPAYKLWHLLIVILAISLSPLFLSWATKLFGDIFEEHLLAIIFAFYGILVLILLFPAAFYILSKHKEGAEHLMQDFDAYLDAGELRLEKSIAKAKIPLKELRRKTTEKAEVKEN